MTTVVLSPGYRRGKRFVQEHRLRDAVIVNVASGGQKVWTNPVETTVWVVDQFDWPRSPNVWRTLAQMNADGADLRYGYT